MKTSILAIATIAALSACAKTPSAIAPVSMGNAFQGVSCGQAKTMLVSEQQKLAALTKKQNGAVVGDALGVVLIGVPVSSLAGGSVAGDIGSTKGKINALQARLSGC